jgi:hypothetical protein
MITLDFSLHEVLAAAEHAINSKDHKRTFDESEAGVKPAPALWWVKNDGTYLMTNGPWAGGGLCPAIAYAQDYGPGTDVGHVLGGDDFAISLPLLRRACGARPLIMDLRAAAARGQRWVRMDVYSDPEGFTRYPESFILYTA